MSDYKHIMFNNPNALRDLVLERYINGVPQPTLENTARRIKMATYKEKEDPDELHDDFLILGAVPPPFTDVLKGLPELDKPVLTLDVHGEMVVCFLCVESDRKRLVWWNNSEGCAVYNIIGWMDLPLIPKSYFKEKHSDY